MRFNSRVQLRLISRAALIFLILSAIWAVPTAAQTQNAAPSDVQQLQQKLDQMEKQMQELRDQITAVQQAQKEAPAPATTAAEVSTEKPPKHQTSSDHGTTLDLYGFVMLDSGYDFRTNNPDWFDTERPTKLPAFKGEFAPDGKVYFGVRQTRFGVKTSTETALGKLKTQFEFELFGTGVDAGQTTFRLRHAYGELGFIGAGQTWSPFMDIDVFPNSLEYWGPNGMVFFRNVQVRFMPIRGERNELVFGIERPGASADQGIYADRIELVGVKPKFDMPDFSWHYRGTRNWGYVQVGGIFRKISWVDTNNDQFNLSGDAFGWGLSLSSNVKFSPKNLGKFQVVYGEGIQNYMNDAPVDIGIQNNPGNAKTPVIGVPLPVLGVVSFLDHTWNEHFDTSIGYSMMNIQNTDGEAADAYHQGHYALGNLLYHPVKKVTIGSEFQFGRRLNFKDGFNQNDYRVQFSFKYDWSKKFEF
jgi:hypothetical protein